MLSVRDLVRQIPAEWQENVKHRAHAQLPRVPRPDHRPARATGELGVVVLGRPGDPRHPRPLGRTTCRPSGCTWSRCRRRAAPPRPAVEAVQPRRSASTASTSSSTTERRQPVARRARDRADPADQPARSTTACSSRRRLPAAGPRAARPPDPVAAHRLAAARRCRPTCALGDGAVGAPGSRSSQRRGYDVVGDLDDLRGRRRADAPFADPDHPDEATVADAAVDAIMALLLEERPAAASVEQRLQRASSTRRPRELGAGLRCGRAFRGASAAGATPPTATGSAAAGAGGLPAGAGQELAVGVAADLPGGVAVGARADQAADDRDPAADRGRPAACRRPW